MGEKARYITALLVTLVVVIIVIGSAFALSYSSLNSNISEKNQKISELNNQISQQNSTITGLNSTIAGLRANQTNLSLNVTALTSEVASLNANYSQLNLLFTWVHSVYGTNVNVLFLNSTTTVPAHTDILFVTDMNPSNDTTVVFLSSVPSPGTMGNQVNGSWQNTTILINSTSHWGYWTFTSQESAEEFGYYFDNTGSVSETFNFTMLELWRS